MTKIVYTPMDTSNPLFVALIVGLLVQIAAMYHYRCKEMDDPPRRASKISIMAALATGAFLTLQNNTQEIPLKETFRPL